RACIQVVDDEVGSPTWTVDLARAMREIIDLSVSGPLYHLAGGGAASRYDLAKELFSMMGIRDCRIEPVSADNFPLSARRPADSSLASEHLEREGITPMRPWREALQDFVDQYLKEEMAGRMVR
ncbi:MAG: sugar nucleotide-binding protein, partial [Gemmatimonadota bacterium]|nr:sugar nucleotide-binding protein [Gemmatimonadota bacterium]